MRSIRLIFLGILLGIILSTVVDQLTYKPVIEQYNITFTQDWEKTATPKEKAYYNHLLNTKP